MTDRKGRTTADKFPYVKGHCRVCGKSLPPRRSTMCSEECVESLLMRIDWNKVRKVIYKRDNGVCQICGVKVGKRGRYSGRIVGYHVDHIIPICKGGSEWDLDNLRLTCADCNLRKGGNLDET